MLSPNTLKDLDIESVGSSLHFSTLWGKDTFIEKVKQPIADISALKIRQLPLMALKAEPGLREQLKTVLKTIDVPQINDLLKNTDPRIKESVEQILWSSESVGAFLNKSPTVLNALIIWKTLFLPCFAVVMPLIALVLPFVILQLTSSAMSIENYLERMRTVLLQQITIPVVLKSRSETDVLGFLLERLFISITIVTFVSSIWNQITPAIHLRHIWFALEHQGQACIESLKGISTMRNAILETPLKKQKALKSVLQQMDEILEHVGYLESQGGVTTYAYFYNDKTYLQKITDLYSTLDVLVTLASIENICFPNYTKEICLRLRGTIHPIVKSCISNKFESNHAIVTGPNRGGKSTFCKALGLAVITAQTWGFAWAESCTLSPFQHHLIALTPSPSLGETSTFESEIDFAKSVVAEREGNAFVMMDEIFHSTNAHDGVKASRIFLSQLYTKSNVISLISTHYHELATEFESKAKQLYLNATLNDACKLSYSYKVCEGISNLSSVLEILEERGLYAPGNAVTSSK